MKGSIGRRQEKPQVAQLAVQTHMTLAPWLEVLRDRIEQQRALARSAPALRHD
jgi:hypothetical protein